MDIIPETPPKHLTSDTTFSNYHLSVDAYSKTPKLDVTERITNEEVIDKLDMFQARFGKIDKFGWWDLGIISADAGTLFTSMEFQDEYQTCGVWIMLEALDHQEMNGQVEVTWRTLRMIYHSLMVHAQVSEAYIHFLLIYTADHIFLVLLIKYLIDKYREPTM